MKELDQSGNRNEGTAGTSSVLPLNNLSLLERWKALPPEGKSYYRLLAICIGYAVVDMVTNHQLIMHGLSPVAPTTHVLIRSLGEQGYDIFRFASSIVLPVTVHGVRVVRSETSDENFPKYNKALTIDGLIVAGGAIANSLSVFHML